MPIYFVSALSGADVVAGNVKAAAAEEHDVYTVSSNQWLINFPGTSKELSERVGWNGGDTVGNGTGIVIPLSFYYGLAPKDMWEWIEIKQKPKG